MTGAQVGEAFAIACGAGAVASIAGSIRVARPTPRLTRANVRGVPVPAILGEPLVAGLLAGAAIWLVAEAWASDGVAAADRRAAAALAVVVVALFAAGRWDDLRGDERPRGFSGHIAAARGGRVTGGIVKLLGGGVAGLAAGAIVSSGRGVVEIAALVALTANVVNLLDRAPGRAAKVALIAAVPIVVLGARSWTFLGAGAIGAVLACLPLDLSEKAMLGDAGANPLGGVLGLALGLSLGEPARLVAVAVVLVLNAASERFSFSRVIQRTPPLRALDMLGRRRDEDVDPKK